MSTSTRAVALAALASLASTQCLAVSEPTNDPLAPKNAIHITEDLPEAPTQLRTTLRWEQQPPPSLLECYQQGNRVVREEISGIARNSPPEVAVTTREDRQVLVFRVGDGMCVASLRAIHSKTSAKELPATR